jgi:hypothetical protein
VNPIFDEREKCGEVGTLFPMLLEQASTFLSILLKTMNVGPCHHGMARPQVADGGTASYRKSSCE